MSRYVYRRTKQSDLHKVYERAEDKNVSTVVVFTDGYKCYADKEYKHAIDPDTLSDLYLKGFVIEGEDTIFKPVAIYPVGNQVAVLVINQNKDSEEKWVLEYFELYSRKSSEVLEDPEEEA